MGTQLDTLVVLLDDGPTAQAMLSDLLSQRTGTAQPMRTLHLVLVACPPRMTHRMSKWLSHRTREGWRQRWQTRLHEAVQPVLQQARVRCNWVLADGPLHELTQRLKEQHQAQSIVDLRRSRLSDTIDDAADGPDESRHPTAPDAPGRQSRSDSDLSK